MLSKKCVRFLVSNVWAVVRLKELITRLSLAHIVIMLFCVRMIPQGSVSKVPSSSSSGKLMMTASDLGAISILERSLASRQLFNRS